MNKLICSQWQIQKFLNHSPRVQAQQPTHTHTDHFCHGTFERYVGFCCSFFVSVNIPYKPLHALEAARINGIVVIGQGCYCKVLQCCSWAASDWQCKWVEVLAMTLLTSNSRIFCICTKRLQGGLKQFEHWTQCSCASLGDNELPRCKPRREVASCSKNQIATKAAVANVSAK